LALVTPVLVLLVSLAGAAKGSAGRLRGLVSRLLAAGTPVATSLLLLALYNYARFDSFFETGVGYQLGWRRMYFDLGLFPPNLYAYLVRPFTISCHFPFVEAPWRAHQLVPSWLLTLGAGYHPREPTLGILIGAPIVFFGLAAVVMAWTTFRRCQKPRAADIPQITYVWFVGSCLAIFVLAGLPNLTQWLSTMRYLSDVTSGALFLGFVGFWTLLAQPRVEAATWLRRGLLIAGLLVSVYTVTIGLLIGFQSSNEGGLQARNPALYQKLAATLPGCSGRAAGELLRQTGPGR